MSKYLSTLLDAREPGFSQFIERMETAAAGAGVDVRLTAEIRAGVKSKIAELGLDPADTTAAELYQALLLRATEDNGYLSELFSITPHDRSARIIDKIAGYFETSLLVPEMWSLKRTALKKLLQETVPLKTMRSLHYRSAASMLKRESPAMIYAVAMLLEGTKYKRKLFTSIKQLQASDFEIAKIEIVKFSAKRWLDIQKQMKRHTVPVFGLPEANAIVVIPAATEHTSTLALLVSALLLHEVRRLKEQASYLKFRSLDVRLHQHVQTLAHEGHITVLTLQDRPVYWHHMHRVFAKQPEGRSYLEPHVTRDDLEWNALEASLASMDERLAFWIDTHTLGFASDTNAVSLHLIDVCLNALYNKPLAQAGRRFLHDALWDELTVRYLEVPPYNQMAERHMYKMTDSGSELLYDEA